MEADTFLPNETYYQLLERLQALFAEPPALLDMRSALVIELGEVAGIFPAWIAEDCIKSCHSD